MIVVITQYVVVAIVNIYIICYLVLSRLCGVGSRKSSSRNWEHDGDGNDADDDKGGDDDNARKKYGI